MHDSVRNYFRNFSNAFEGTVPFMYLDQLSLATIGTGTLLEIINATPRQLQPRAFDLPFQFKTTGVRASRDDVEKDFNSIVQHPGLRGFQFEPYTLLQLDDATIDELVSDYLSNSESALARFTEFAGIDEWPADAQLGLYSMAYAMGNAKFAEFTKFRAACKSHDFVKAAAECRMKPYIDLDPRNRADEALFTAAARVIDNSLPLDQLTYPNIVKKDGTVLYLGLRPSDAKWPKLKKDISGQSVAIAALQTLLFGPADSHVTGTFDDATDQAVKSFQLRHTDRDGNKLKSDGVVGDNTWRSLILDA